MLLIVIEQLILGNPISVKKISFNNVVIGIDRTIVTDGQRPIIVWPSEWSPYTNACYGAI